MDTRRAGSETSVSAGDTGLKRMADEGRIVLGHGTVPEWFMKPALPPLPGVVAALLKEREESPW